MDTDVKLQIELSTADSCNFYSIDRSLQAQEQALFSA